MTAQLNLITELPLLDTLLNTGLLEILGDHHGENKDTLDSPEETPVDLLMLHPTLTSEKFNELFTA